MRAARVAAGVVAAVAAVTAVATATRPGDAASQSSEALPNPSSTEAMHACARVFELSHVGSAGRTTVGDVRKSGGGPATIGGHAASMPAVNAFGDEPDSAPAYWCWIGHPGDWTLYGIDTHGTRVAMYQEYDKTQPFPAPPPPDGMAAWL